MKDHCRQILQEAYLFMDREQLSPTERAHIRQHLEECQPCYERYGLETQATALISRLRGCDPCPEKLRSQIGDLLRSI